MRKEKIKPKTMLSFLNFLIAFNDIQPFKIPLIKKKQYTAKTIIKLNQDLSKTVSMKRN